MSTIPHLTTEAGWQSLPELLELEFAQSAAEGRDPAALACLRAEGKKHAADPEALMALHAEILQLPVMADFPFEEPSDLDGIRALRADPVSLPGAGCDEEELFDRLHGAWLGRCCGCALGKPVESFMKLTGPASWERQKRYLGAISTEEWPLRDYIPEHSPAEKEVGEVTCPDSTRERLSFMETDDDIRYTVLGQILLEQKGPFFTTADAAGNWFRHLPYRLVCTAETQAYRNLVTLGAFYLGKGVNDRIDWNWVVTRLNPYREWIGAQIRVDSYGYACPGDPESAAELAWRDARLSHVKNGLYGAMFCAAMIAASFTLRDPRQVIEAGLAQIPRTSRLHADIRTTIALCERHDCAFAAFEEVIRGLHAQLGHHHAVHTNNNAALCVAALLLSGGDFHKAITLAVMGGWDTDCNGATVGSIVGILQGAHRLPAHWTARLNDTLRSEIAGYHPIPISECARRSLQIVRASRGGRN